MAMTHVRECTVTGKRVYLTLEIAEQAVLRAHKGRSRPLRIFFCKSCKAYHVTRLKRGDRHAMERGSTEGE